MAELAIELRRPRGWRRWRLPLLAAGLIAATLGVTIYAYEPPLNSCNGDSARIAEVWGDAQRVQLRAALRSLGTPYAVQASDDVIAALDSYTRRWRQESRGACIAHRDGALTPQLYNRQVACLSLRLDDVRTAIAVITAADRSGVTRVMDVVANLPNLSTCATDRVFELPETPALQLRVAHVRAQISFGLATASAGHAEPAIASLDAAARQADAIGFAPLQIEAGLAVGRTNMSILAYERARAALVPVRDLAFASRLNEAAIEASARLLYVDAMIKPDVRGLEHELVYLIPLSKTLAKGSIARLLLLNNIGGAYVAAARMEDAYRYFHQAIDALHGGPVPNAELVCIYQNVAKLTKDPVERESLVGDAWRLQYLLIGPEHPSTLDALVTYGMYTRAPSVALAHLSRASESYRRAHPTLKLQLAYSELRRAFLMSELGDDVRAIATYRALLEMTADDSDADLMRWRNLAAGELALLEQDPERAARALGPVLAATTSAQWWERADGLHAAMRLGEAELQRGHDTAAVRYLEMAIDGFDAIIAISGDPEHQQLRAGAKRLLAELFTRGGNVRRANELLSDARDFYRASSSSDYARWLPEGDHEGRE